MGIQALETAVMFCAEIVGIVEKVPRCSYPVGVSQLLRTDTWADTL